MCIRDRYYVNPMFNCHQNVGYALQSYHHHSSYYHIFVVYRSCYEIHHDQTSCSNVPLMRNDCYSYFFYNRLFRNILRHLHQLHYCHNFHLQLGTSYELMDYVQIQSFLRNLCFELESYVLDHLEVSHN